MPGGPEGGGSGLYNEDGQVADPGIAHEMANIEKPYHEKILGFIPTSEARIAKGEAKAEERGERRIEEAEQKISKAENAEKLEDISEAEKAEKLEDISNWGFKTDEEGSITLTGKLKNYSIEVYGTPGKPYAPELDLDTYAIIIDGQSISPDQRDAIHEKYRNSISAKFKSELEQALELRKAYLRNRDEENRNRAEMAATKVEDILK